MADVMYPERVAKTFNQVARELHEDAETGPSAARIRDLLVAHAKRIFPPGTRLLEVGCRTGFLTMALLRSGFRVVAIDASEDLLRILRERAAKTRWIDRLEIGLLPNLDVSALAPDRFEGAILPHGVANLLVRPEVFAETLADRMQGGAPLLLDVLNRHHVVELLGYAALGRVSKGFRKLSGPVPLRVTRSAAAKVPTQFYAPREIAQAFRPWFAVREVVGMLIGLPPPSFDRMAGRFAPLLEVLARFDERVRTRAPFNRLGHHFLLRMDRHP